MDSRTIVQTSLKDVTHILNGEEIFKLSQDELIIIEDLSELPDFSARKVSFNIIAACISGKFSLDVAGFPTTVQAGQIFISHSHSVLSNFMISPDFKSEVMCISDRLLRRILQNQMLIWNNIVYRERCIILDAEPQRLGIYNNLHYHWKHKDSPFRNEIQVSLLRAVLLELCEMLMIATPDHQTSTLSERPSRMETLFQRFLENITRRHVKKQSVAIYADELCITPKYLSTVCRTVSGKSPTEWITEYVNEDIINYLRNTDLSAKEISDELGFPNSSYFGRYVKEQLGTTPFEYRKKLH